jgi:rod shape-determining protein MreC
MPVLALFGNSAIGLIGQVIEVYPNFSKVMLISDPSFAVDVKVVRTGDRAIVRGKGEPILSLEYLPLYSQAQPKDIVVTSGQDALFPANLIIGEIVSVTKDPQGLFKQGEVRPYVDVYNLNWVAVILQIPEIPL